MSNTQTVKANSNDKTAKAEKANVHLPIKDHTIEELAGKVSQLNTLYGKRERLIDSRSKLQSFGVTSDENLNVQFSDGVQRWSTSNSDVIQVLLREVSNTINNSLIEIESKIRSVFD